MSPFCFERYINMDFLSYFYEISKVSRPSGNCSHIADYLCRFAEDKGLRYKRDRMDNVIIYKDATAGYEEGGAVMLQGHTDMVCCCDEGVEWDFSEGVRVIRDGDWLKAEGTTLGADNGIACAYMLAILADESLCHPALECVFTSDEETGLYGAEAIDLSACSAKYLINMDSEEEGIITAGCCGGLRMNIGFEGEKEFVSGPVYRLAVTGLKGGHSGVNIDNFVEVRVNAIIAALHAVKISEEYPTYRLVSIDGGEKDNAIPRSCAVTVCGGNYELIKNAVELVAPGIVAGSPDGKVTFEKISDEGAMAFTEKFTNTVVDFFNGVPNGVLDRCPDEPGLPPTISDNFGVVRTEEGKLDITISFRAYDDSYRDRYSARVARVAEQCGAKVEIKGKYPGWDKTPVSPLRDKMCQVWKEMTGEEMKVQRIHAGLECGVLIAKRPGLDAASIGPEMWDVHTPKERLNVPSAERTYGFICKLLSEMN